MLRQSPSLYCGVTAGRFTERGLLRGCGFGLDRRGCRNMAPSDVIFQLSESVLLVCQAPALDSFKVDPEALRGSRDSQSEAK